VELVAMTTARRMIKRVRLRDERRENLREEREMRIETYDL